MQSIIENVALATQILGSPVAKEALAAQIVRDQFQRINFASLIEVLRANGFDNNISKRPLENIPSLSVPVVLFLGEEEAAVVTRIEGKGSERRYHLRQDDGLTKVISHTELNAVYFGFCWFIKPKVSIDSRSELPEYSLPKAWFWKVIWRFRSYYYQVILATFLVNFLALVSSLYVMNVYDRVIPNKSYETLWVLSIGVILAICFEFMFKLIRSHLTDIAGKKADLIISSALFRRVMAIRLADKPASSGSYANNLRDFEAVREFMTSASLLVLVDLPFLLLFVFVIWLVGGKLALVPLTIIPIVIISGLLIQPKIARYTNESMKESSQRQGLVVEVIEGIETLKANNATSWAQQRWDFYTAKTSASQIKMKDLSALLVNFVVSLQQLNTVFLVLLGSYLIHSTVEGDRITMGALIASVILSGRALSPLAQIAGLANRYQQAKLALSGVNNIIERPTDRRPDHQYIRLDRVEGRLHFNNIGYKYTQDGHPALTDVTLTIQPGEKVGILGKVGSGKTTLLNIASGLFEPQKGSVTLDNVDLRQIDPNYLRNQVGLLSQSPRLFLGSLRENMNIARQDNFSSDQELLMALRRFGLDHIIKNHPRGLDMPLGENGMGLSGGQRQLVALARLTLRDPKVVLLDEPTHSLDPKSENLTLNALARWSTNRTLVVVTHRPQVLQLVERVIVVDEGKVIIDGKRDAVLRYLEEQEQKAYENARKSTAVEAQAVAQQTNEERLNEEK